MYTTELMDNLDFSINDNTNRYYNQEGISVPRVTEILSAMIHSDKLMIWANSLGFRGIRYMQALNQAADIGTEAHARIEMYLKEKVKTETNIPFLGFLRWEKTINEKGIFIDPIFVEIPLTCQWFGGTADAVFNLNGRTFLIDFKTSNHVTFKYFLQLAAYKYMLELIGVKIDGVIVLQLDKKSPGFNEYLLDFSIPDHLNFMNYCSQTFFSLVWSYYNVKHIEIMYNQIF